MSKYNMDRDGHTDHMVPSVRTPKNLDFVRAEPGSVYKSDIFGKMLNYLSQYPVGSSMKQTSQHIILEFSTFKNCIEAKDKLEHVLRFTNE